MYFTTLFVSALYSVSALAAPLEKRASRTSPPSGCLVVRGSGTKSGEYSTVGAAITALGSGSTTKCVFIYGGTYKERVVIKYAGPLTIYGETTDTSNWNNNKVILTGSLNSATAGSNEASATLSISKADLNVYNINVYNTAGNTGQALAVYTNGDRQGWYGVKLTGWQDTLYAGSGYQYYSNSYIEGAVDWIFGNAAAWFGECTIAALRAGGVVTANSRETASDPNWYVFDHSTITNGASVAAADLKGKVYLGRPWRVLARVMYQNSKLTAIVHPDGYTTMAEGATPIYEEINNTGDGSSTSARKYFTKPSAAVTKAQLWPKGYSFIDTSY